MNRDIEKLVLQFCRETYVWQEIFPLGFLDSATERVVVGPSQMPFLLSDTGLLSSRDLHSNRGWSVQLARVWEFVQSHRDPNEFFAVACAGHMHGIECIVWGQRTVTTYSIVESPQNSYFLGMAIVPDSTADFLLLGLTRHLILFCAEEKRTLETLALCWDFEPRQPESQIRQRACVAFVPNRMPPMGAFVVSRQVQIFLVLGKKLQIKTRVVCLAMVAQPRPIARWTIHGNDPALFLFDGCQWHRVFPPKPLSKASSKPGANPRSKHPRGLNRLSIKVCRADMRALRIRLFEPEGFVTWDSGFGARFLIQDGTCDFDTCTLRSWLVPVVPGAPKPNHFWIVGQESSSKRFLLRFGIA